MAYLIAILVSILLLAGFLLLTAYERSHARKIFPKLRAGLDRKVGRGTFVLKHVDWSAFLRHLVQAVVARVVHDVAQVTLVAVRVIERLLTRVVRTIREQTGKTPPTPRTDGLRATLIYFRKNLRTRFHSKSVVHNTDKE
ncbi:hypothetical protein KKH15_01795 [Patescibacteria group bacterium]|nr:hypothetical protein [Patescibacteria group bacterium]MBU1754780.1 hypothetical protein [Patescibacteria group bacterium]